MGYVFVRFDPIKVYTIDRLSVTGDILTVAPAVAFVGDHDRIRIRLVAWKKALLDPKRCGKLDGRAGLQPYAMEQTDLAAVRIARALYEIAKDIVDGTAKRFTSDSVYAELLDDGTLQYS